MSQDRKDMSTLQARVLNNTQSRGAAAPAVLIGLCLLLGGAIYLLLGPSGAPDQPSPTRPAASTREQAPKPATQPQAPQPARQAQSEPSAPTPAAGRFEGTGSLGGAVDLSIGEHFPAAWTLVLEPASFLPGAEHAETQRIDFTGDQRDFELSDLPLAGYAVRAEAAGFNGQVVPVLLERTSPGAYLMLQLSPAGFLTGQVTDAELAPLEGFPIWLYPGKPGDLGYAPTGGQQTTSLPDGTYTFEAVLDGPYSLLFGSRLAPLAEPLAIQFRAPSLTVPAHRFAPLSYLRLMVVNERQEPLGGALIHVKAPDGDTFEVHAQPDGMLHLRHMIPGHYQFTTVYESYSNGSFECRFIGGERESAAVTMVPR